MKKFYITSAIAYPNAKPHIGFAYEEIIVDTIARWHRLKEEDVFFLTGTDEHGTKIQKVAEEASMETQKFVDMMSEEYIHLKKLLNLSFNGFIRTSDKKIHYPTVEKIWNALVKSGDIYKKKYRGLYCYGCESFKTERELVNGLCPDHQRKPKIVEEENYFFRLSKYADKVLELIESGELKVLPKSRENEIVNVIKSGLEDVSFSRSVKSLKWGIPVPEDSSQVMYVWCDALTNYLSGIGYTSNPKKFKKYWPADVHVIGKDILRFHAVIWPAMLLSVKLQLPKTILVHGIITSGGQKISKTLGNIIDPYEQVEKYGVDALRYFLLREIPTGEDGDFSKKALVERINGELVSDLGNLIYRVLSLTEKFDGKIEGRDELSDKLNLKKIDEHVENFELHDAIAEIWSFVRAVNKYITEKEPWRLKGKEFVNVLYNLVEASRIIAILIHPFMPETAEKINEQFGVKLGSLKDCKFKKFEGRIKKGKYLFEKVEG